MSAIVWGAALLLAAVVLGYGGYELAWKSRRLQRDLAQFDALKQQAQRLQGEVEAARHRVTGLRTQG